MPAEVSRRLLAMTTAVFLAVVAWTSVATSQQYDKPCSFGPVSMRVDPREVHDIVYESLHNPRLAWYRILALEEDPELEPFTFSVASEDDGLGRGLWCPEEKPPVVVEPKPGATWNDGDITGDPVP